MSTTKRQRKVRFGVMPQWRKFYTTDEPRRITQGSLAAIARLEPLNFALPTDADTMAPVRLVAAEAVARSDLTVRGHIEVRNLAFEKRVGLRFTFDSWRSMSEQGARYTRSVDSDTDVFIFSIVCPPLHNSLQHQLSLAVYFDVLGHRYWDNNQDRNFECCLWQQSPSSAVGDTALPQYSLDEALEESDKRRGLAEVTRRWNMLFGIFDSPFDRLGGAGDRLYQTHLKIA